MQNKFTKLLLAGVFGTTLALPAFGDGHSYGHSQLHLKDTVGTKPTQYLTAGKFQAYYFNKTA